jgi:hypothetical protein
MTLNDLNDALDNIEILYYESGAYYDCDLEDFLDTQHRLLESKYNLSLWEA